MARESLDIILLLLEPLTWILLLILFLLGIIKPFFNYLFDVERIRAVKRIKRYKAQRDAPAGKGQEQQETAEAESGGE